jgi:hypothetical protein
MALGGLIETVVRYPFSLIDQPGHLIRGLREGLRDVRMSPMFTCQE